MWVTRDTNGPQVKWGKTYGQYDNVKNVTMMHAGVSNVYQFIVTMFVKATSSTYSASDMCDSPAKDYGWIDPGMIHSVVMDG